VERGLGRLVGNRSAVGTCLPNRISILDLERQCSDGGLWKCGVPLTWEFSFKMTAGRRFNLQSRSIDNRGVTNLVSAWWSAIRNGPVQMLDRTIPGS